MIVKSGPLTLSKDILQQNSENNYGCKKNDRKLHNSYFSHGIFKEW
jgi:hypothetical protein